MRMTIDVSTVMRYSADAMDKAARPLDEQVIYQIHRFVFDFDREANVLLASKGSSFRQFLALTAIEHCSDMPQKTIAENLSLTPAAISRTIDSLVERGFAERAADSASRRTHRIRLTQAGTANLVMIKGILHELAHKRLAALSAQDKVQLAASLKTVRQCDQ